MKDVKKDVALNNFAKEKNKRNKYLYNKKEYDIISENCTPLEVNYKKIYERDEWYMRKTEGEKYIKLLEKICEDFNIKNSRQVIKNYCKKTRKCL